MLLQSNEQVSLYFKSTRYFKSHYSQLNIWCQLCQIYDSVLFFFWRLFMYVCVLYILYGRCWLMNERRIWNFAEALMNIPKENPLSDLQAKKENYFNSVRKAQATICIFLRCMLQDFRTSLKMLTYPSTLHLTLTAWYREMRLYSHIF